MSEPTDTKSLRLVGSTFAHPKQRALVLNAADEIERLREALEYYVCDAYGQCREVRLKDGTCIHASTGRCGKIAQDALLPSAPLPFLDAGMPPP